MLVGNNLIAIKNGVRKFGRLFYLVLVRRWVTMRRIDQDGLDYTDKSFKAIDNKVARYEKRARKRYFKLLTANYIAYERAKGTLTWKP